MHITIIGAGNIGSVLGRKWAAAGHTVRFGVRSPAEAKFDGLRALGPVLTTQASLEQAEVILLALPGAAVAEFASGHAARLDGRIVIDATNNVRSPEMNNLAVLQEKAPGARLVRAFSTLGWENFEDPQIGGMQVDLFYCAQADCRSTAEGLITAVGLRPICVGGLEAAALVDGMTRLWFALAFGQARGRRIAFKLLQEGPGA